MGGAWGVFYIATFLVSMLGLADSWGAPKREALGQGLLMSQIEQGSDVEESFAFLLERHEEFSQKKKILGFPSYGFSQARIEIGNPFGVVVDSFSGLQLYGLSGDQEGVWPFLGAEPFGGRLIFSSGRLGEHFYEWLPMVSMGLQVSSGDCSFLPLFRTGFAVGSLNSPNLSPRGRGGLGYGFHVSCADWNLGMVLTNLRVSEEEIFQTLSLDFSFEGPRFPFFFGVRGEFFGAPDRGVGAPEMVERRVMFLIRSELN